MPDNAPTDILYVEITSALWENDAGPLTVGNKLRGYLGRAEFLGHDDIIAQAKLQLDALRGLVPNLDELFAEYDAEMEQTRMIFKEKE